ncbi:hypothetical protein [Vibrio campbellii]|uniref:hypothetical protein n=1 Tax=Vibrio campbellii TaxID=680 RepID=UPI00210921DE|nr:hypothetical protein [Vibrio campbellii]UTZ44605.1 hypothetical protein HB764_25435 [Vibrio campbellii]
MSTLDQIRATLKNSMAGSSWWARQLGSQFTEYLVLFLSKVVERCEGASQRALQESFLSLATKRSSILAGAEDAGYVRRKISPSKGNGSFTSKVERSVSIPQYAPMLANNQLSYMPVEAINLTAGGSKIVQVLQVERSSLVVEVDETKDWYSVVFSPEITEKIHKVEVFVNGDLWEKRFKFRNCSVDSKAYMEYYKSTDQLGIRFADNITAKGVKKGDRINFELWLTQGETTLLDGQKLEFISPYEHLNELVEVTTETSIVGGDEAEGIESIQQSALYLSSFDEQVVWDGDFKAFIKQNVGGLAYLSVWGEAEQEKLVGHKDQLNVNKVFICCYAPQKQDSIEDEILSLFKGREGYNEHPVIAPRNDNAFTVAVSGHVKANAQPEEAERLVRDLLVSKFGKDVYGKPLQIYKKDLWKEIEANIERFGITSFEIEVSNLRDVQAVNMYQFLDIQNLEIRFTY